MMTATSAALALERCDLLAAVSARPDGIERVYLSPQHAEADRLAADWMREAGLATWMDAAGNRCGRLEGRTAGLPALLLGSHLDTVPDAGRYDGVLGVMVALLVAGRLAPIAGTLPFALEVVAFPEEEGVRFGATLLGSRALAGTWDPAWWSLTDADGVSLARAFRTFGLDPAGIGQAARPRGSLVGYLESHIEQGPELEDAGRPLGVVTSIAGARRMTVRFVGEARHAGGTPYERRHDALLGASEAVVEIERIGRAYGVIATVGQLEVFPGAVNVVPGTVDLTLDLRARDDESRDEAWGVIEARLLTIAARRGLAVRARPIHVARSVRCDDALRAAVAAGIGAVDGGEPPLLWSRAGHDAMAVADLCPVGMQFVRCHDGISHHPDESVLPADVDLAVDALERSVLALAASYDARGR